MTQEIMTPPMELSAEDAAVFDRVWRRVMAGREQPAEQNALVPMQPKAEPPAQAGQTDGLLEQIRAHSEGWMATRALARRATGSMARVLGGIAADERRQLARLAAVWFVATGQRWRPQEGNGSPIPDLMEGLRQRYLRQRHAAQMLEQAAQVGEEPIEGLYADLARSNRENANQILRLLEQMQL